MPDADLTVYVVDDDTAVRDSLALMLAVAGYRTAIFADAEAFLAAYDPRWAGCVIADLRLPGLNGLELQAMLGRRGSTLPYIVITGHGDVSSARTAFRAQAVDFLEKPFDRGALMAAVEAAFARESRRRSSEDKAALSAATLGALTPREREVLAQVAAGRHAKEIAAALGISPRTVEVHKARIMSKVGARNMVELARIALDAGMDDGGD
jgi:FixJ family two-component response regulator